MPKYAYPLKVKLYIESTGDDWDAAWEPLNTDDLLSGKRFVIDGHECEITDWEIDEYAFNNERMEVQSDGERIDLWDIQALKKRIEDLEKDRDHWKGKAKND